MKNVWVGMVGAAVDGCRIAAPGLETSCSVAALDHMAVREDALEDPDVDGKHVGVGTESVSTAHGE